MSADAASIAALLEGCETFGCTQILGKVLGRDPRGGRVVVQVSTVHEYSCPFWRIGQRHGPCECGALAVWNELVAPMWTGVL